MLREQGYVLRKLDTRCRGLDWLELAADIDRSLRLGVELLVLTHATPSVEDDAGLGFAPPRYRSSLCLEECW